MSECSFLGFTIKGKKIRWTDKVLADFKHRVKERRACRLVEPPTADPHGGWCGGWELKTPGYPIGHLDRKGCGNSEAPLGFRVLIGISHSMPERPIHA